MNASLVFDHIGLNVPDLDAAAAWYRVALGLEDDFAFAVTGIDFAGIVLRHPTGWRLELLSRQTVLSPSGRDGPWWPSSGGCERRARAAVTLLRYLPPITS